MREKLNARWALFSTRIHIASFLLDPRFRDILSSKDSDEAEQQFGLAEEFIKEFDYQNQWQETLEASFISFRSTEGSFSEECTREQDPLVWWGKIRVKSLKNRALADIAIEILSFPASAASVERSFSIVRRVHTWQRNRLGRKKLAKLIYIYMNTRALDKC